MCHGRRAIELQTAMGWEWRKVVRCPECFGEARRARWAREWVPALLLALPLLGCASWGRSDGSYFADGELEQAVTICRGLAAGASQVDPGSYSGTDPAQSAAWGHALGSNAARSRAAFNGCMAERGWVRR
jgi:hypothetical protein